MSRAPNRAPRRASGAIPLETYTPVHARRIRPDAGPTDRRRVTAAVLSSIVPGLGQAFNRRLRPALWFAVPSMLLILIVLVMFRISSPTRIAATVITPTTLAVVMLLNALVLLWRLVAVGHAFGDSRYRLAPGRAGIAGLVLVFAWVSIPHAVGGYYGYLANEAFSKIFQGRGDGGSSDGNSGNPQPSPLNPEDDLPSPGLSPEPGQRVNVLLMGIDSGPRRNHSLTDTLIVVSLDGEGKTVSMVSIPRDMVDVPLGNGKTFAPKINSLLAYANRNRAEFPQGGTRALQQAVGALLGVPIHYYAKIDLGGFVEVVNAVGGIDVTVKRALSDPQYGGYGVGPGWSIKAGKHHLDGKNALAYARIRKSAGESDFTRAERQQQVLIAIRDQAVKNNLLISLPGLLKALAGTVRTDLPEAKLPEFAALAEEIDSERTLQVVIRGNMVRSGGPNHPYGSVQIPNVKRIQEMAKLVFSPPGTPPVWPPPKAGSSPEPSPSG